MERTCHYYLQEVKALTSNVQYFLLTSSRANMSLLSRSLVMSIKGRTCHYYPYPFFMISLVRWFVSRFLQSYKTKLVRKISKTPFGGGVTCLALGCFPRHYLLSIHSNQSRASSQDSTHEFSYSYLQK